MTDTTFVQAFLWRRAAEGNESAIRRLMRILTNDLIAHGLDPR